MRYLSTRGLAAPRDFAAGVAPPTRNFEDVLLAGLAEDGGLFLPETWPVLSAAEWRGLRGLPYHALAARLMQPFVGDCLTPAELGAMTRAAYAGFGTPAVVPLHQLDHRTFALELFHGPTLAFKDWRCNCWAGCLTTCCKSAASGSPLWAPPAAILAQPPSRPAATALRSTSSSSTRKAAPAKCSAGR